jgi:hypothetical protein
MNTISLLVSITVISLIIYFAYKPQSEDKESSIVKADTPEIPKKEAKSVTKPATKQVNTDTKTKKTSSSSPKKTTTKK